MKMRLSGAVLAAAASLLLCASPAWADYQVKDGNGTLQTMKSWISSLIHHPGHVFEGLFGGTPTAVSVDSSGNINMNCVSGCAGGSPMQSTGGTVGLVAGSADIGTIHLGTGSAVIGHVIIDSGSLGLSGTLPAFAATPTFNLGTLNGAATASGVAGVVSALGSPFQAGGSIGNTSFGISGTLPAFAATPTFNIGTGNITGFALEAGHLATIDSGIGTLSGKFPSSLGSKTSANSLSVVFASDQLLPAFAATPTFNIGTGGPSGYTLEAGHAATIDSGVAALHTDNGTDGTSITQPTGGAGIRGWLSGIYKAVSGTLTVTHKDSGGTDMTDTTNHALKTNCVTGCGSVSDGTFSGTITAADSATSTVAGQAGVTLVTGTPTASSFVTVATAGRSTLNLTATGTFVATAQIEGSADAGVTYAPVSGLIRGTASVTTASITAPLSLSAEVAAFDHIRFRASAYTSGTLTLTGTLSAAPGPVKITNPAVPTTKTCRLSFTIAASSAYAAGDVIGPSTGSSAAQHCTGVGPYGATVYITNFSFQKDLTALATGETTYTACFYSVTPPSALVDNAAWDLPSGDRASFRGCVALGTPVDLGSTVQVEASNVNKAIDLTGNDFFVYFKTEGAHTDTAASTVEATFTVSAP